MKEKAIKRLESILDWSDRIGSDEINVIEDIISILKLEDTSIKVIENLKKSLKNKLISTEQVLNLIDNHIEYLETSDGDELPSITIENLEGILNNYFNKK